MRLTNANSMLSINVKFCKNHHARLMTESSGDNFQFRGLVEDARIIMQGCACEIKHILREGNTCADALAKFGAEQPEDLLLVNEPPMEIRGLLVADILGVSRERA
ncbi:hypothetical protein CsSME_00029539 [Camellia sinensis var. sinensis]